MYTRLPLISLTALPQSKLSIRSWQNAQRMATISFPP